MRKLLIIALIGCFAVSSYGQKEQHAHELSIWGAGGISSLQYKPVVGDHKIGFGGIGGLGYTYYFSYHWGLGLGAEFSFLSAKTLIDKYDDSYPIAIPVPGGSTVINMNVRGQEYTEKQNAMYINIPLMLKYQFDVLDKHPFYVAFGPKLGIPVGGKYKTEGQFTTTGHDPATNDHYTNMKGIFGTFDIEDDGKLKYKMNYMLSLEAGVKWKFNNPKLALYTGLFCDYGLNDIRKVDENKIYEPLFNYDKTRPADQRQYAVNSMFDSRIDGTQTPYVKKVNTVSFGVKVAFGFSLGNKTHVKKEKDQPEEKPYEGLTAKQLEDILGENTDKILDAQSKEFEELKKLLAKEEPDFTARISGFNVDKWDILSHMIPELDRKAEVMKKYPDVRIELDGHADATGPENRNQFLGMKRAESVKAYLVGRGVDPNRIDIATKSSYVPVVPNDTETNRWINRRVEIMMVK